MESRPPGSPLHPSAVIAARAIIRVWARAPAASSEGSCGDGSISDLARTAPETGRKCAPLSPKPRFVLKIKSAKDGQDFTDHSGGKKEAEFLQAGRRIRRRFEDGLWTLGARFRKCADGGAQGFTTRIGLAAVGLNATPRKAPKNAKVELRACNTISCRVALRAPRGGPPGSLLPGMGRDRMREASPRRSCGADRRGRATKQTAPRRRNPKGRSSWTGRIKRISRFNQAGPAQPTVCFVTGPKGRRVSAAPGSGLGPADAETGHRGKETPPPVLAFEIGEPPVGLPGRHGPCGFGRGCGFL